MIHNIFGHGVERQVDPEGYDGSLAYECRWCGLRGNKLSEFDQTSCDEYNHNPAKKGD